MGDVVTLRQVKKQAARKAARAQADANAAKFGRSKLERATERARAEKSRRELEGHKRDPE